MNDNDPPVSDQLMFSIRLRVLLGIQCGTYLGLAAKSAAADPVIGAVWLAGAVVTAVLAFSRPA